MRDERLEVSVTFDERGYVGSAPELRSPVVALSLGGLRRKIGMSALGGSGHAAPQGGSPGLDQNRHSWRMACIGGLPRSAFLDGKAFVAKRFSSGGSIRSGPARKS
jgi:hypothetical protein